MRQWILESTPLLGYGAISKWLQDLYGTSVELDGRGMYVDIIESFEILHTNPNEYVVIAKVGLEEYGSPVTMYHSELDIEVDTDARRN